MWLKDTQSLSQVGQDKEAGHIFVTTGKDSHNRLDTNTLTGMSEWSDNDADILMKQ